MDEQEFIEIESPIEEPVDAEDDEVDEMLQQQSIASPSEERQTTTKEENGAPKSSNIDVDKPIHYQAKPKPRSSLLHYPDSLPYDCETLEEFDARIDWVSTNLMISIDAKDFNHGVHFWTSQLTWLLTLKYPVARPTLARLARVYYHLALHPGISPQNANEYALTCMTLLGGRKKLSIANLVLPWRPLYRSLKREMNPKERKNGHSDLLITLFDLAVSAQRFFDPDEAEAMLHEMLPDIDGSNIDSILAAQALLVHFLPTSHPQRWLPTMFQLWDSFSSALFDGQMLELCARLAEQHVEDPRLSSQKSRDETGILADKVSSSDSDADEEDVSSSRPKVQAITSENGLWNEVGIFTERQFALIMTKCLRSAGLPVGSSKAANMALMAQSSTVRGGPDASASEWVLGMCKPSDLSHSFATIIVYSMMHDAKAPDNTPSGAATPVNNGGAAAGTSTPTQLAGSKALNSLLRFIQATESYFHPSNLGRWAAPLSSLVKNLTLEFCKRWKDEGKLDCKTPPAHRLTQEIKREFCMTLRTVCLLSLFSKDMASIASAQASMRRMALLEPDLILPPVLERAYSSLEALETTQRTMSIITALSTLSFPLVSREVYKSGGKHLVPLLHLCLPGIDLNDSNKTLATSMFILASSTLVKIDDLTRPEIASSEATPTAGDGQGAIEEDEEDEAMRLSTAGFEDWAVSFFRRTTALFEMLPEEGKGGRSGGRIEEQVTTTLLAACSSVCCAMSEHMFDITFKIVADYCLTTVSPQAVRMAGSLVSCFARQSSDKVLKRLVKPCVDVIRAELKQGASSIRTTSTSLPVASDATLHWHLSVLVGALTLAGEGILEYRDVLLDLLELLGDRLKTERGYNYGASLVQRILLSLVTIYPNDHHFLNPEDWNSETAQKSTSYKLWGKMYSAKDVKVQWHVPTDAEVDFALEVMDRLVVPSLDVIERLQQDSIARDKAWSNDFCRHLTVVRQAYSAMSSMIEEDDDSKGTLTQIKGMVDGFVEFNNSPMKFKSGFLLQDKNDARYQKIKAFKVRFGEVLHFAAQKSKESDAEDQIDCVRLLLRSIRTHLTAYAHNVDDHQSHAKSMAFFQHMSHIYPRQKDYPRIYWIRRAAFHHTSRGRLNSLSRKRSELSDKLTIDVAELTTSNYTAIRKTAQNVLEGLMHPYLDTRALTIDRYLEIVRSSDNDDQVKGALYVLRSKTMNWTPARNPFYTEEFVMSLLEAQHRSKPSIQKLLRDVIVDFIMRFPEPSTAGVSIEGPQLSEAMFLLGDNREDTERPSEPALSAAQRQREAFANETDRVWDVLVPRLLAYLESPKTHWVYRLLGARLLRTTVRKDRPLRADVASYFAQQLRSEDPMLRRLCQAVVAKILFYAKLQTLCKTDRELVLGSASIKSHPLKRVEAMPKVTVAWRAKRLESFKDTPTGDTKLFDKDTPGWLVWSDKRTYYAMPPESGTVFDWAGKPALDAIEAELTEEKWQHLMKDFALEKDREGLSRETTMLVKSIFQVFGVSQLRNVQATVKAFVDERDRHKHRAAAEVIAGMCRGAKHWPQEEARELWAWLDTMLPKILAECTPDSEKAWQAAVKYIMYQRDPRRALPLVNMIVKAAREAFTSSQSPWEQVKTTSLLSGVMLSSNMKMSPWTTELRSLYQDQFLTEFNQVRRLVASSLTDIDLIHVAPSFASVTELLDTLYNADRDANAPGSLLAPESMAVEYSRRLDEITARLQELKKERRPKSQGTSQYDLLAQTALIWIAETMGDLRRNAMTQSVISFIPTIFECCNLQDNAELSGCARGVLLTTVSIMASHDSSQVGRLIRKVLAVVAESQDSWRARLDALPVLQVLFFQNIFYLDPTLISDIIQALLAMLSDPHLEVRNLASATLSGIVRCSQRDMIHGLRRRFVDQVLRHDRLPKRGTAGFTEALTDLHAGILGSVALIGAFPYSVPKWMPSLICDTVARHQDAPDPVGPACKKMAADFKRTHQDTWEEDKMQFNSDQLAEYYEWGGRTDYYA